MEEPSFRLGVKHLKKLVRWKTRKGNEKLPSKKRADLLQRWNDIKGRESPHISPCNSGDELDVDDQSEVGEKEDDDADETSVG